MYQDWPDWQSRQHWSRLQFLGPPRRWSHRQGADQHPHRGQAARARLDGGGRRQRFRRGPGRRIRRSRRGLRRKRPRRRIRRQRPRGRLRRRPGRKILRRSCKSFPTTYPCLSYFYQSILFCSIMYCVSLKYKILRDSFTTLNFYFKIPCRQAVGF